MSFSQLFSELPPPPQKLKSKKKRLSDFAPPPYEVLDTRLYCKNVYIIIAHVLYTILRFFTISGNKLHT